MWKGSERNKALIQVQQCPIIQKYACSSGGGVKHSSHYEGHPPNWV